ncbi:unnamed protein product [Peniophora sp. CBMAI 1063]|nr:unnamed protein product [Peniophora sp. CBMAI 1063]
MRKDFDETPPTLILRISSLIRTRRNFARFAMDNHEGSDVSQGGNISTTSSISSRIDKEEAHAHSRVPALDNPETWAAMTDVALRHICRVRTPYTHREDLEGAELKWPEDLPRSDAARSDTPVPTHRLVLVNEDVHIPAHSRHPTTAPYILQAISEFYPALADRPSQTYAPYSRRWRCPHTQCPYSEDLVSLSPAAGEAVCRIAATAPDSNFLADDVASEFVSLVDGRYRARREFARDVVDIIGLRHYEVHLRDIGLRCWIRGQAPDGFISFMWEPVDLAAILRSSSIDGVRARRHEECARQRLQLALSVQARRWAHETRFWEYGGLTVLRNNARSMQYDFVRALALPLVPIGVEERYSQLRTLSTDQSAAILAAGRKLHRELYDSMSNRQLEYEALTRRLALAEEEIQNWERGDGWLLTQDNGDGPELHAALEFLT